MATQAARRHESHCSRTDPTATGTWPAVTFHRSERPATAWSPAISIEALCERLALLFLLEVPCILNFRKPGMPLSCRTPIQGWERRDGRLILGADRFSLHLCEEQIEALCVIQRTRDGRDRRIVELRDKKGALRARILGPCSTEKSAVWQDIMDTFILPMVDTAAQQQVQVL